MHLEKQATFLVLVMVSAFARGNPSFMGEPENGDTKEIGEMRNDFLANINQYFDESLPSIHESIIMNAMDPMELPNWSKSVSLRPSGSGVLQGNISLNDGWLQDLSTIRRSGDITVGYSHRFLTMNINLGWERLNFSYKYLVKLLVLKRRGDVIGRVEDLDVNLVLLVDTVNYEIHLQRMEFTNASKFMVQLLGHTMDWMINEVSKLITLSFKEQILNNIELRLTKVIHRCLNQINASIKPQT